VAPAFHTAYREARAARLNLNDAGVAWGAPQTMPPEWVRLRRLYSERVVDLVFNLLGTRRGIALDTSAGAGYVSFALAERGLATIHADLDPQSIVCAVQWKGEHREPPLLVVRADYFALPLRGTADVIVATDSLIRGMAHEMAALEAIRLALRDDGFAVVDFHNWLHNPLRRLGVLPDNFVGNRSYFHWEVRPLLRAVGLEVLMEQSYRQEEDQSLVRRLVAPLVPPTRFIVVVRKARREASAV
jgi:SAM-dependent methyltransferase